MKTKISSSFSLSIILTLGVSFWLIPSSVYAHHMMNSDVSGLRAGLDHAIAGIDHILAMIAIGLWAVQLGSKAIRVVPATFVGVLLFGMFLGSTGLNIFFVEEGILGSVLALGVLIAFATQLPLKMVAVLAGLFAIFHGNAMGIELRSDVPNARLAAFFATGFTFAAIAFHLAGIGTGIFLQKWIHKSSIRFAGACIALSGIYLWITR